MDLVAFGSPVSVVNIVMLLPRFVIIPIHGRPAVAPSYTDIALSALDEIMFMIIFGVPHASNFFLTSIHSHIATG